MSVTPSPIAGFAGQFFDNNGIILSGGKIFTYAAGTTTPQATYTSATGVTPHANPIILDSAGRVPGGEIWLTDSLIYKFVIETSTNVLIGTYDNITGVNSNFVNYTVQEEVITATAGQTVFNLSTINYTPGTNSLSVYIDGVNQYVGDSYLETDSDTVTFTSGLHVGAEVKFTTAVPVTTNTIDAANVSYDPPFTGSVPTNVEDKLAQYVSVKDFGAVGDGVADDTAAINAALTASAAVYFPAGEYKISSTIIASYAKKQGPVLTGDGPHSSKLVPTAAVSVALQIGESFAFTTNYSVVGLGVDMVNMPDTSASKALAFDSAYYGSVKGFRAFNDGTVKRTVSYGKSSYVTAFYDCVGRIFEVVGENSSSRATTVLVENCEFFQAYLRNAEFINFKDCHIGPSGSSLDKFDCDTVRDLFVSGADIEGTGVAWKLGTNCERFYRIGNFYTGFGGTYQTGSFTNRQNSYDLDGWLTAEMHNSQQQVFVAAYQAGISQVFRTVTGALSGPSFQHDENVTMRIKFGNLASDSHVLWDINSDVDLQSRNGSFTLGNSNGGAQVVCQADKNFRPSDNGVTNLGTPSFKWATVYAAVGVINTSDERQKTDVADVTARERAVAERLKGLVRSYRLLGGGDKKHFGVIAQQVIAAFADEGLNASDYGVVEIPEDDAPLGVNYSELFTLILTAL